MRRLDFFLVSNSLQDHILRTDILPSIESDHSPITVEVGTLDQGTRGPAFWKFPSYLVKDLNYVNEIAKICLDIKNGYHNLSHQAKWEYAKFKIREFSITFSKNKAKERKLRKIALEKIITDFECKPNYTSLDEYQNAKSEYDMIQTQILDGQILRSKCQFYESGEKPTKFFLNLEKKRSKTTTLQRLCIDPESSTETTQNDKILQEIKTFYTNLYAKATDKSVEECELFLCNLNMPTLSIDQINFLNIPITV